MKTETLSDKRIPTIEEELKNYNRKELIEEIARLRIVIIKGNSKAYQKAKKIFLDEKKEFIKKLKEEMEIEQNKFHEDADFERVIDKLAKKYGCDNQNCTKCEKVIKHACDILINNYQHQLTHRVLKKDKERYRDFMIGIYNRFDELGLIYSSIKDIGFNEAIKELGIDVHIKRVKEEFSSNNKSKNKEKKK